MNSNNQIAWIFVGIIVTGVVLSLLLSRSAVNWYSKYELNDKQPYGISFLYKLLEKNAGEQDFKVLEKSFDEIYRDMDSTGQLDDDSRLLYIYMGYDRNYDSSETASLLEFVREGHIVFRAAEYVNTDLIDTILEKTCPEWRATYSHYYDDDSNDYEYDDYDYNDNAEEDSLGYWHSDYTEVIHSSRVTANFVDADLYSDSGYVFYNYEDADTQSAYWTYFYSTCLFDSDNKTEVLGSLMPGMNNFIGIPYGEGYFYIHTNPELFTNVCLLKEDGREYAEKVFAYMPADGILWDEYVTPLDMNWDLNDLASDNPLSYILSEAPLRWSMYIIVIGSLLFILFRAKRRQQYIPVIEPNSNTSLEYVEMLGQLYFEQKDHRYMASQMWKQFLDFIRVHYYINPSEIKDGWVDKLSQKSTVAVNRIRGIERAYEQTGNAACQEDDLINLYQKLKYFYANCK